MKTDDKKQENEPDLKTPQNAGAPQDESPAGPSQPKNEREPFSTKKKKPQVKAGKKEEQKLLDEDADIHDETTI
jgi:hypothetical protein